MRVMFNSNQSETTFNVAVFVESKRQEIKDNKRQAKCLTACGKALRFFAPVLLLTGVIEGFALAPPQFRDNPVVSILPRLAAVAWIWMDQNASGLWTIPRAI